MNEPPVARPFVALAHARPGDYVDLGDRGHARVLGIAPNGKIYLQPVGYPISTLFTIDPSLPNTVPVGDAR